MIHWNLRGFKSILIDSILRVGEMGQKVSEFALEMWFGPGIYFVPQALIDTRLTTQTATNRSS